MKGYFEDIRPKRERLVEKSSPVLAAPAKPEKKPVISRVTTLEDQPSYGDLGPSSYKSGISSKKIIALVILIIAIIAGLVYGLSFVFRGATITVTPKSVSGTLDALSLSASKSPGAAISYSTMTITDSVSKQYAATVTDVSGSKASGTVVLYNMQTVAQSLAATTRFADPKGIVFRLPKAVTIPKATVVKGKTVPGQLSATLVADATGPDGNIGLSDFTVVAFAGTAKAKLVYGRGSSIFSGGSSGDVYYLNDSDYATIAPDLLGQLSAKLADDASKQIPDGYILLPGSLAFTPDPANKNPVPQNSAQVTVTLSGSESGILLKKSDLETAYIHSIAPEETITPDQVNFIGEDSLAYAPTTALPSASSSDPVSFTVSGPLSLVWKVNPTVITQTLVGIPRSGFASHMQVFSSVKNASLVIVPFWINMLPSDQSKIHIVIANQ